MHCSSTLPRFRTTGSARIRVTGGGTRPVEHWPRIVEPEQVPRQASDIIQKGVGVQIVMPVIEIAAAMELVSAALGHQRNLCARVPPVLSLIRPGQDFEFRHGIEAHSHVLATVGASIDIANAINRELVLGATVTVDLEAAQTTEPTH